LHFGVSTLVVKVVLIVIVFAPAPSVRSRRTAPDAEIPAKC